MKFFYLILSLFIIGLAACKGDYDAPCRGQAVRQTVTLTAIESAKYPYRNDDTIGFVSNSGDTLLFLADTVLSFESYKPTTLAGNPECPQQDVDAYKGMQSLFKDSANSLLFAAIFRKADDSCYFTVNGITVSAPISAIGDTIQRYQDSVVFPGKTFYKVNILSNNQGDSMIVNAAFGLIYFSYGGKPYYQYKFNSK
ncbi:MAG: hypothetical protein V4651_01700 [Bacteroidota bacterium]